MKIQSPSEWAEDLRDYWYSLSDTLQLYIVIDFALLLALFILVYTTSGA